MSQNLSFLCHSCGEPYHLASGEKIYRGDECKKCGQDLRVCLNCEFYDKQKYNECREPVSEAILNKDKRNSCDFFKAKILNSSFSQNSNESAKQSQRDLAEALFKKKPTQ